VRIQVIVVASLTTSLGALGHATELQNEIQASLPALYQAQVLPPFSPTPEGYESLKNALIKGGIEDRYLIISLGEVGITTFTQILADKDIQTNNLALIWGGHQYLPELDPLIGKLDIIDLPLHERSLIEAKVKNSKTKLVSAMGVPNDFTPKNLNLYLDHYRADIEAILGKKTVCIGVFLGGDAPDRQKRSLVFTSQCAAKLGEHLKSLAKKKDAAVIITAGVRTQPEILRKFVSPFENSGLSYKVVDANTKGFSYALLAFLKEASLLSAKLPISQSARTSEVYVTFDSITMGTAVIETQAPGSVTAMGIDSMSDSHLAFADLAYNHGLVSYLKWDQKNHEYEFLPRLNKKETESDLSFARESAARMSAKGMVKVLTELNFFVKSKDKIAT